MSDTRYGRFTAITSCPHCGQPLPLNGPIATLSCAHCLSDVNLPGGLWSGILQTFDDTYTPTSAPNQGTKVWELGGFRIRFEYGPGHPSCEKCGGAYPMAGLTGHAGDFRCVACGDAASSYQAPTWLSNELPTAKQVISVDPGTGGARGESAQILSSHQHALHPVAMSCPSCGGGLQITSEMKRVLPCHYCQSEVYIPDMVWRRLHPVKIVKPFFVRFEGPSKLQQENEKKRIADENTAAVKAANSAIQAERAAKYKADADALRIRNAEKIDQDKRLRDGEVRRRLVFVWAALLLALLAQSTFAVGWFYGMSSLPFPFPFPIDILKLGIGAGAITIIALATSGWPMVLAKNASWDWVTHQIAGWGLALATPIGALIGPWKFVEFIRGSWKKFKTSGGSAPGGATINAVTFYPVKFTNGEGVPCAILFLVSGGLSAVLWFDQVLLWFDEFMVMIG